MKTLLIIQCLLFSPLLMAQSQMEMNIEARQAYLKADKRLNEVYNQILNDYSGDKLFIKNLQTSERYWIKFRDAEMLVKYPENCEVREGSVFPVCHYSYLTKLTKQRINTLNQWIEGEREGEVCSGSVKIKE